MSSSRKNGASAPKRDFTKMKTPHTYAIIFAVILVCWILTFLIPAGKFSTHTIEYTDSDGDISTRTVLMSDTFRYYYNLDTDSVKVHLEELSQDAPLMEELGVDEAALDEFLTTDSSVWTQEDLDELGLTDDVLYAQYGESIYDTTQKLHKTAGVWGTEDFGGFGFMNYVFEGLVSGDRSGTAVGICALILVIGLVLLLAFPSLLRFSEEGPGSQRAFWLISLIAGGVVGILAQRSRLCMAGGIRDAILVRDFRLLAGFVAIWATVTIGNLILNKYNLGTMSQPIAHSQYLWSFLGMALAGWGSVLLGGCPLRQLILAGEGNGDSAVTVLGMVVGAALAHNFSLAGNADSIAEDGTYVVGGIGTAGMVAVILGFVVMLAVTLTHLPGKEEA